MKILFMCVTNATCSQLAEGLAKKVLSDEVKVESAGTHPSKVDPLAIKVLHEIGVDTSDLRTQSVTDLSETFLHDLDFVITLCNEDIQSPLLAQAKRVHWPIQDPAALPGSEEERLQRFRTTLGHIGTQLEEFGREYGVLRQG
ncbi:arsenate reductase ArsC [Oligoflexus tunisiensis]|uniref:arsenate reductase ArsC n=1 Tax=Oligoflexus tunisiensis TaxID=708132 RepID=UPI00114CEDFA|nr:arsenate reductase ArsC [Oligoflexus tunisiensis]